jgi:DNA repair and recombination RAD54-like protein
MSDDDDESYVEASETDDDDDVDETEEEEEEVVMSQRDVKAANIRAMMDGTLETCARPFVRGLTVEDPAVVLRRAFKSPFPNAPDRSGARRRGDVTRRERFVCFLGEIGRGTPPPREKSAPTRD